MTNRTALLELADLLESYSLPFNDPALDITIAEAFDWHERRVTGLGLNGRTRGSMLWFPPFAPWGTKGLRKPPRFSGPRRRKATVAELRARAASGDQIAGAGSTQR